VDGYRYEVTAPATPRAGARGGGAPGEATAQLAGSWSVSVNAPGGTQDLTMTIVQTGESFTGSMSGEMGTLPIADGRISGTTVTWSITVPMGGQSLTVAFEGEAAGDRLRGTADLGAMGSATFTAEKHP
jgi:hypothetical protein